MAPLGKVGALLRLRGCMGCACGRIFVEAGTDSLIRSDVMLETVSKLVLGFICGLVSPILHERYPNPNSSRQGC